MSANQRMRNRRRGVTVVEVLFATGIAISGLLGIASLLLMSGRYASQANTASETQSLAQAWYGELITRGMNEASNWSWYQDYTYNAGAVTVNPGVKNFAKNMFRTLPMPGQLSNSTGSLAPLHRRPWGKYSVCIDPAFYSDRTVRAAITAGAFTQPSGTHWYRPALFPYFQDGFNPTTDPDLAIATTSGIAWTDQPRMLRVTLGAPGSTMNEKQVENLFASQDDLTILTNEKEGSVPSARKFQLLTSPAAPTLPQPIGKASVGTKYSWLATLSPLEVLNNNVESSYTLSLVVIKQRDRTFIDPATFASRTPGSLLTPDQKPKGERVVWVVPQSGNFVGGNGGRVTLVGSAGVDDEVTVGDWIMLGKHVAAQQVSTAPPLVVEPFSVFRWYRIIGVDGDAVVGPLAAVGPLVSVGPLVADPYGNSPPDDVWARNVVLEGPDWTFFNPALTPPESVVITGNGATLLTPTTGTLVQGAVSVYERVIDVPVTSGF